MIYSVPPLHAISEPNESQTDCAKSKITFNFSTLSLYQFFCVEGFGEVYQTFKQIEEQAKRIGYGKIQSIQYEEKWRKMLEQCCSNGNNTKNSSQISFTESSNHEVSILEDKNSNTIIKELLQTIYDLRNNQKEEQSIIDFSQIQQISVFSEENFENTSSDISQVQRYFRELLHEYLIVCSLLWKNLSSQRLRIALKKEINAAKSNLRKNNKENQFSKVNTGNNASKAFSSIQGIIKIMNDLIQ